MLHVVDVATRREIKKVNLRESREKLVGVAVAPDGSRVYVATGSGNSIKVVDTATWEVLATVPVGRRVWGIALTRDGKKLYTCDGVSNTVSVVDTVLLKTIKQIDSPGMPWGVVIDD